MLHPASKRRDHLIESDEQNEVSDSAIRKSFEFRSRPIVGDTNKRLSIVTIVHFFKLVTE